MKNLPVLSGWEPYELRDQAHAMRERAEAVLDGKWCRLAAARGQLGERVPPEDPGATCYCMGSHNDYFTPRPLLGLELLEQSVPTIRVRSIPRWNDDKHRKRYQVARAFRAAAARAERYATILEAA